jgi:hypothetical protein
MADAHDLLAAERFLAAEVRIAATFGRIEEAVAPVLRGMRATGRTTYVTDPERGAIWGHAFLRPPYAPDIVAEWFLAWGLRFPDGGTGWDGADPPLPRGPHAIVALGACGVPEPGPCSLPPGRLPQGWSVVAGGAASLVAALPLHGVSAEPDGMAAALAGWTLARLEELRAVLPEIATDAADGRGAEQRRR